MSLFSTLTRMWMLRGQQRKIRAPGVHPPKRQEYAATDWRTGTVVRARAEKRDAEACGRLVEKCVARSARRNRRVIRVTDSARIQRPETSKRVAELCQRSGRRLRLWCIPQYSPECMPLERLWNDWRDHVTHNHDRQDIWELESDSDHYFKCRARVPRRVRRTLGSPFAHRSQKCKN